MRLNPYLSFDGRCREAFEFYEKCLGGKLEAMLSHENVPAEQPVAPGWRDKILHAYLTIGDQVLMGADQPPEHYEAPTGFSVAITLDDSREVERVFRALAERGTVRLPLQKTFFSSHFGMVVDRFGIPWMINSAQGPA